MGESWPSSTLPIILLNTRYLVIIWIYLFSRHDTIIILWSTSDKAYFLIFDQLFIVMGYTVLLSFEWKHVINESKMEQEQHKTMKNNWKRKNSLGSGEIWCVCVGVTGVDEVWRGGGRERGEGYGWAGCGIDVAFCGHVWRCERVWGRITVEERREESGVLAGGEGMVRRGGAIWVMKS